MRSYLSAIAVAISVAAVFATDARVETMGGTHSFMKDDQSMFTNPATVGDYDRLLMGSYGVYLSNSADSTDDRNFRQYNRDAKKPNFGATISFGKSEDKKSKFTIGAMMNRYDPMLKYIDRTSESFIGDPKKYKGNLNSLDTLVGKTDLVAGYTLNSGLTIGLGGYLAFQSDKIKGNDVAKSRLMKANLGVAGPVSENVDLEASVSFGSITLKGAQKLKVDSVNTVISADNDPVITADLRVFADMPAINGKFVPHIQANIVKHHTDETLLDFNGGIGFNANIDRGFLWGGFEGIYQNDTYATFAKFRTPSQLTELGVQSDSTGERSRIGGRVSFGIERNILTDWLVWRVGGSKLLAYEKLNDADVAGYWLENNEDDHVSFGMGVNIEDRFRVDAVVSENMLYTFSNLFSGNSHHFSSKISATFAF